MPPILQFKFTNNLAKHNSYGIIGTGHGVGSDTISVLPGGENLEQRARGRIAERLSARELVPDA